MTPCVAQSDEMPSDELGQSRVQYIRVLSAVFPFDGNSIDTSGTGVVAMLGAGSGQARSRPGWV